MHSSSSSVATAAVAVTFALLPMLPASAQAPLPKDRSEGAASIVEKDLVTWLTRLSSEEFAGRATGQEGFRLAATMVAEHFQANGLVPYGDEHDGKRTFWQQVPWASSKPVEEQTFLKFVRGGDAEAVATFGVAPDGLCGTVGEDVAKRGDAVWLQMPTVNADLAGLDLADKIVFVQAKESLAALATDPRRANYQRVAFQLRSHLNAASPAAIVFVDKEMAEAMGKLVGQGGAQRGANPAAGGRGRLPSLLALTPDAFAPVLRAAGVDAANFASGSKAVAVPLAGLTADLAIVLNTVNAPAYNVVGVLPGSDPALKDEYVVIGSHLDHLGKRRDQIYPGADDDGSGTTGVLALAQAFAKNPVRPRRSVMFVCFCGEENGLIGSAFFARNPPVPLANMVAELQMDMIGRDEEHHPTENRTNETAEENKNSLHLIGTKRLSNDLHELCLRMNETVGAFDLEFDQEGVYSRSDHYNFARHGVPIAFFFTGFHRDYHQPTDTVEKINFGKLARVVRYVYAIAFELAQMDGRPLIEPELWAKSGNPNPPVAPLRKK